MLRLPNCQPLYRPLLTCTAHNFQLFCPYVYLKYHLFNVYLTIFAVNLNISPEMPPLRKCRPGRLAASAPPWYATAYMYLYFYLFQHQGLLCVDLSFTHALRTVSQLIC